MTRAELRKSDRVGTRLVVRIERVGVHLIAETINLSLGGALLRVAFDDPPRIGEQWSLGLVLPTLDQPLLVGADVRWLGPPDECGVQFTTGFRARETWALGQWLDRIRKGLP